MDEGNTSQSTSCKEMVSVNPNVVWSSNIKTKSLNVDQLNSDGSANTEQQVSFMNIKIERDEFNTDLHEAANVGQDYYIGQDDPLLMEAKNKRPAKKKATLKHETKEARERRLARMSAYTAHRLANESPIQRAERLKRMAEYTSKRLAQETQEQRALRLSRMSETAAKRLANETAEQRQARLAKLSAYAAKRNALKRMTNVNIYGNHMTKTNQM